MNTSFPKYGIIQLEQPNFIEIETDLHVLHVANRKEYKRLIKKCKKLGVSLDYYMEEFGVDDIEYAVEDIHEGLDVPE
ncbi:hypothetical protein [Synechococcus phage S-E7]|uniref:Uncharacterized protein n=1 Tax=Synechococcus phage S-P4 TaxID=2484640 RepID=A0A3G3M5N2_9CAUD|nr:hypothetical protein HOU57_gp021 [Synechococcus phage S-P4]AYR01802.1 hypothetical protein [Synechococcus phage S-P4]AYR02176.1 hypothetical protein [Synechococcus phage S-E7]